MMGADLLALKNERRRIAAALRDLAKTIKNPVAYAERERLERIALRQEAAQ